ncbi:MAG: hypothetical protein M1818_006691 [Claussenomyces sp. TS43310]|nr:MAG: hypothetical protein M1818_006691 [Claussenomyces sp. TS43310]
MALHAANGRRFANKATHLLESLSLIDLPVFLCPNLLRPEFGLQRRLRRPLPTNILRHQQARCLNAYAESSPSRYTDVAHQLHTTRLPRQCAGCGAPSQTVDKNEAGFYTLSRRSVKAFLGQDDLQSSSRKAEEGRILLQSLQNVDSKVADSLLAQPVKAQSVQEGDPPVCDRCHKLLHHQTGVSIHHPSIDDIRETVFETPHKYNHIYHVIDAADFPTSLIPGIHRLLQLTPQRSMNRRSKTERYYHGKQTEVSFIITRSDLLAPLKTQVDSLMPYLTEVLRDALGSFGKNVRLGNVRCVSAKRGWWTKELKEDIWKRGGGGWMVGKVNVGKSQLFESVFPKGRRGTVKVKPSLKAGSLSNEVSTDSLSHGDFGNEKEVSSPLQSDIREVFDLSDAEPLNTLSLLPPARPETDYPAMPLVSSLPGTTASPIRVPFGNGKGELIDLPGLSRGDLELHVQEPHRQSLVMRSRVVPEQQVIKPGQSLLLGGFIRITPTTPDVIVLAYAFTPIAPHLTSTEKAIGIQTQERVSTVQNIATPGIGAKIASAGTFALHWDVTKKRSGPLTSPTVADLKASQLPYQVLSTDILIEGCGWVELVAQIRKKTVEPPRNDVQEEGEEDTASKRGGSWPEVEVFSPDGRFISARRPLGAWLLGGPKKSARAQKARPGRSMKGAKKNAKVAARVIGSS